MREDALPPLMWLWYNRKNGKLFSSKSQTAFMILNFSIVILGMLIVSRLPLEYYKASADPLLQFGLGMWSSRGALNQGSGGKIYSCENNWPPVSWVARGIEYA